MSHPFHKRLVKEYKALKTHSLVGIELVDNADSLEEFKFQMKIPDNALYAGKTFKLWVKIVAGYPVEPLSAKFTKDDTTEIPVHPHIYSNGHICLNTLGTDWTPACSIETVLLSLQSMLANNSVEERPPDDARYTRFAPDFARSDGFVYHDNSV